MNKHTKEQIEAQIKTLKTLLEDKGDCRRVVCTPCYFALFDTYKVDSCHNEIGKIRKEGETNLAARRRLAEEKIS